MRVEDLCFLYKAGRRVSLKFRASIRKVKENGEIGQGGFRGRLCQEAESKSARQEAVAMLGLNEKYEGTQ